MNLKTVCAKPLLMSLILCFWSTATFAARDLGIILINSPQSGCQLSNSELVQIDVQNFGEDLGLLTSVTYSYSINGGVPVSDFPVYNSWDSLETKTHSFTLGANLSAPGTYNILITVSLSGDVNADNDTMSITVVSSPPTVGGQITGGGTVCSGMNAGDLILTGHTGEVQHWESSTDGGSSWQVLANTTDSQSYNNITQTTMYRAYVKSGFCPEEYSDTATLLVDPQADAGMLAADAIVCTGMNSGTLQLSGYAGNIMKWQYDNGNGWTDTAHTADNLDYNNLTATTAYRVILESGVCPNDTSNVVTITVIEESLGGSILSDANVCEGDNYDTLFLTGHLGDILQWEFSDDGGFTWVPIINTDSIQVYNNLTVTTQYRAQVQSFTCPPAYSSVATITVDQEPDAGILVENASVCSGSNSDTLVLTGYFGNIVKWEINDGNGWQDIANTTDEQPYSNISVTTSYRAIVANGACPDDTSNIVTISVIDSTQGGAIAGSDTVCAGMNNGTLTLSGHVGTVDHWESSTDGGFTWFNISNSDTFQVYNNLTITTQYRALVSGAGCSDEYSEIATVTVDQPTDAGVLESDGSVCGGNNGDTLFLKNYLGDVVKWQFRETGGWQDIAHTDDFYVYNNITQTTRFRVIVKNGACPQDTSNHVTISVIANTIPGTLMESDTVCETGNFDTLVLTGHVGDIENWEFSEDGGFTWLPISNTTTEQVYSNLTATRDYRVLITADGCPDVRSNTVTITVEEATDPGTLTGGGVLCDSINSGTIRLNNFNGEIVGWKMRTLSTGWVDMNHDSVAYDYENVTEATQFRVFVQNGVCGIDSSNVAALQVNFTYADFEVQDVCFGDSVIFTNLSTVVNGTLFQSNWDFGDGNASISTNPIHDYENAGVYDVRLVVESDQGCLDTITKPVEVFELPDATITVIGEPTFCDGDSTILSAPAGYPAYEWSTGETTQEIVVYTQDTYEVTVTDNNGCQNTGSIFIEVYELPIADAGEDMTISLGQTVELQGNGGVDYLWSPGTFLDDPTLQFPMCTPANDMTYILLVTDENGCQDTDTVMITVLRDFNFTPANLITANNDGYNDTWFVENLPAYPDCEVVIFSKQGQTVFATKNYNNDWAASYKGQKLPDDTYYYVIQCPDGDEVFKGHITVVGSHK